MFEKLALNKSDCTVEPETVTVGRTTCVMGLTEPCWWLALEVTCKKNFIQICQKLGRYML